MSEQQSSTILTHRQHALEVEMVGQERWAELRRLHEEEGQSISAIARRMELDRKTVRRCVRARIWRPFQLWSQVYKLLTPHADWLQRRAPEVHYSARILYQELTRERGTLYVTVLISLDCKRRTGSSCSMQILSSLVIEAAPSCVHCATCPHMYCVNMNQSIELCSNRRVGLYGRIVPAGLVTDRRHCTLFRALHRKVRVPSG